MEIFAYFTQWMFSTPGYFIYPILTVALPIATAGWFLHRRNRSALWSIGVALVSLVVGAISFCIAAYVTMRMSPDLNNGWGIFAVIAGLMLGFPAGTWGGAWGFAVCVQRKSDTPRVGDA